MIMVNKFKTLLLFCLIFSTTTKCSVKNFAAKCVLFYTSQLFSTTCHEMGHALVAHYRKLDPKIIIGQNGGEHNPNNAFISISSNFKPNGGVTVCNAQEIKKNKEKRSTRLNLNILNVLMGPTFGILSGMFQLFLIDCFNDKIDFRLQNSFKNFMFAKIVEQFIYGYTPFDQEDGGDGAKLFTRLHLKYKMNTNFFNNVKGYQDKFSFMKENGKNLVISHYLVYFFLKLINHENIFDVVAEKFDNKIINPIWCYLKYRTVNEEVYAALAMKDEEDKKKGKTVNKNDKRWMWPFVFECVIF